MNMNTNTGRTPRVSPRLVLATDLVKRERYDEAIATLKALLADEPDNELALGMLGGVYLQIRLPLRAISCFDDVLARNGSNLLARFQKGVAHGALGDTDAALAAWEPLLADQNEFMARFHSAAIYVERQEFKRAKPLLEQAKYTMPRAHPLYGKLMELVVKCEQGETDD